MNTDKTNLESIRIPAIDADQLIDACQFIDVIISELSEKNKDISDVEMRANIFLSLRDSNPDVNDEMTILAMILRSQVLIHLSETDEFKDEFTEDGGNTTDDLLNAVARFPMWSLDAHDQTIKRLYKFFKRVMH